MAYRRAQSTIVAPQIKTLILIYPDIFFFQFVDNQRRGKGERWWGNSEDEEGNEGSRLTQGWIWARQPLESGFIPNFTPSILNALVMKSPIALG